jgi:hypothetical protein
LGFEGPLNRRLYCRKIEVKVVEKKMAIVISEPVVMEDSNTLKVFTIRAYGKVKGKVVPVPF